MKERYDEYKIVDETIAMGEQLIADNSHLESVGIKAKK